MHVLFQTIYLCFDMCLVFIGLVSCHLTMYSGKANKSSATFDRAFDFRLHNVLR